MTSPDTGERIEFRALADELEAELRRPAGQDVLQWRCFLALRHADAQQQEIEAAWGYIERGYDIEERAYFEREAPRNGFDHPLVQALHHIWKRDPKVAGIVAAKEAAEQRCVVLEAENDRLQYLADSIERLNTINRERAEKAEASLRALHATIAELEKALSDAMAFVDNRMERSWTSDSYATNTFRTLKDARDALALLRADLFPRKY